MVSVTGLGCNNFGRAGSATETLEGTRAVLEAALEHGVNFFDTADIYGAEVGLSESLMGQALQGRRDEVVLATKFGHTMGMGYDIDAPRGSRTYIRHAAFASLRRLQTDRIDLFQMHEPDPDTPVEETLTALEELVDEGVIGWYGHSNFTGWQIAEAELTAQAQGLRGFVSAQNHYSLLVRAAEREVLVAANRYGLGFLPFYPLHNGLLSGKFTRDQLPADTRIGRTRPQIWEDAPWDAMEAYSGFCATRGVTMLEATFGWLLAQPGVTSVIAGATTPAQIEANAKAGRAWTPDAADLAAIDAIFPLPADPGAGA